MPVGGFAALCVRGSMTIDTTTWVGGEFHRIKILPPFHTIKGTLCLNFNTYRISHKGIILRLEANLEKIPKTDFYDCDDIFKENPVQVLLARKSQ